MRAEDTRPAQICAGIAQPRRRIHIPASTPSPESGPPTAGVLNLSHDPSSPGAGFRGVPGEPASLPSRRSASPLGFSLPVQDLPGSLSLGVPATPLGRGVGGESSPGATPNAPSPGGEEFCLFPNFGAPQPTFPADGRFPRPAPRPWLAYLGVHTKITGPRRRSHIVVPLPAPARSPGPRRGAALRRPPSSGGGCRLGVSSKLHEEQRACGPPLEPAREPAARRGARDSERAAAPGRGGGDRSSSLRRGSGQTLFSSSVAPGLVGRRRPPPPGPRPRLARATDTVRGRRLKGTPRLFLPRLSPRDSRGSPGPRTPRRLSLGPRDVAPQAPRPPGAPRQDARRARRPPRGASRPRPGNPASRAPRPRRQPGARAPGRRRASARRAPGPGCLPCDPSAPSRHPSCVGEGVRFPGHRHTFPHLPAPPSLQTRAHNEMAQSTGAIGLLRRLNHAGLTRVHALTSPESA